MMKEVIYILKDGNFGVRSELFSYNFGSLEFVFFDEDIDVRIVFGKV